MLYKLKENPGFEPARPLQEDSREEHNGAVKQDNKINALNSNSLDWSNN